MPEYSHRPEKNSIITRLFSLDSKEFERNFEIPEENLARFSYSPDRPGFRQVQEFEHVRGLEVMYDAESSTLIVPPPTPGVIGIGDLATMAVPVVKFIEQQKPDIVVGCDRGARIYAVAVHSMWGKLKDERFPTLDQKLHFARLSTSLGLDITSGGLAHILNRSTADAKAQGKGWNGKRPQIMFIDDWIVTGSTRRHVLESLDAIGVLPKVDISFAVMCGPGADASGRASMVNVPWHDDPDIIGINYTKKGKPMAIRTEEARELRRKVHQATKNLARRIHR